jgi:COP9 signalosome complex subunit 7
MPNFTLQLQASAHSGHYELLELFAYGTVGDYTAGHAAGRLPEVSPPVLQKLRMLTVASLASQQRTLPYSGLYADLGLVDGDSRGLEEVVIAAVQAGLVAGRIDQRAAVFEVSSVQGRDVRPSPESIDALLTRLRTWRAAVDGAAADASAQLQRLHEASLSSASHAAALSTRLEEGRRAADKAADKEIEALGAAGGRRGGGGGYRVGLMAGMGTAYGGGEEEYDDNGAAALTAPSGAPRAGINVLEAKGLRATRPPMSCVASAGRRVRAFLSRVTCVVSAPTPPVAHRPL